MTITTAPVTVLGTREQYLAAVEQVRAAAAAYYADGDIVCDDATYDALVRGLAEAETQHPEWKVADSPTDIVGGVTVSVAAGKAVAHTTPMLSLDNLFAFGAIDDWVAGRNKTLGRTVTAFSVEKKYDGSACSALYVDGRLARIASRGDGTTGEDRTYAVDRVQNLPRQLSEKFNGEVRGEIMFRSDDYEAANEARVASGKAPYVNARNAGAGALSAETLAYDVTLTFFPYSAAGLEGADSHSGTLAALRRLGFTVADDAAVLCHDATEVKAAVQRLADLRGDLDHAIDGAVIKVDRLDEQSVLGLGSRAPRWAIAYKYPADTAISTLEEVIWQVGRTGVITPRARITPTLVGGTIIEFATLHNPGDIERKGFLLGDQVTVLRAGEVIPRLEAPVVSLRTGAETSIEVPTTCPRCSGAIDKSGARWRCSRGRYCGLAESVRYAASRDCWDIEGMGDKIVELLVAGKRVADVADLFTLTRTQLLGLDRMGETSTDKLLAQIDGAKEQPLSRTFCALGIRRTGRSLSRRIAKHFGSMEAIRAASPEQFAAVDGIGEEKAPIIVAEIREMGPVIDKLVAAGVSMFEPGTEAAGGSPADDALPLAGMSVVVTGSMTGPLAALSRNEVNELVERAGGKSSSSVSAKTSMLVAGEKAGSKLAKAESLNAKGPVVEIVTPEEFAERVRLFLAG